MVPNTNMLPPNHCLLLLGLNLDSVIFSYLGMHNIRSVVVDLSRVLSPSFLLSFRGLLAAEHSPHLRLPFHATWHSSCFPYGQNAAGVSSTARLRRALRFYNYTNELGHPREHPLWNGSRWADRVRFIRHDSLLHTSCDTQRLLFQGFKALPHVASL